MFEMSPRANEPKTRPAAFMDAEIYPNEDRFVQDSEQGGPLAVQPTVEALKPKARAAGPWNLFMPPSPGGHGARLTNLDYALPCEVVGRSLTAVRDRLLKAGTVQVYGNAS